MTILCKICNGEKIWPPPVWLMRQAGRYLPEYNDVRKKAGSFLELCYTPEYASEVTLQPIRRFDFDAAIIFADILLISENMNFNLSFQDKIGPIIQPNFRESTILNKPIPVENSKLMNVMDSIKLTRDRLPKEKSLIGFCGAPWTVLSYLVNGTSQSDFTQTIDWMEKNPVTADEALNILTELSIVYLSLQIQAGADVVKIFDSWAGVLSQEQFENWVIKPTKKITLSLKKTYPNTPIIGFPKGSTNFYE
ncbi:MAG: uroporphyrinogen decarboxylase family protein, partial [Hyphomicrobiales bacterium]